MKDLKGKSVFLTGAASGIGRSFANALAKEGMKLFISDINMDGLDKVKNELIQMGAIVHSMKCDVSKLNDIEEGASEFFSKSWDLDLLINNAGIGRDDNLSNIDLGNWENVLNTNLWSVIYTLKVFLPHMIDRKSGHIVNVASMAGLFGSNEPLSYITTKFAIVGLSEGLFSRLKPYGINVSVITPGLINTGIYQTGLEHLKYNPQMVKDHGKEKIDEIYSLLLNNLMKMAMSPDVAVRKYLRQIKKDQLYIFDNQGAKDILALKGNNLKEYEDFLLNFQKERDKEMNKVFLKYGIDIESYR